MNEYYKKYQNELTEAAKVEELAFIEYKVACDTLIDYDKELQDFVSALKEKYDYDTKSIMRSELLDKLSEAREAREYTQIRLVLEVINRLITHPLFNKYGDAYAAWRWIKDKGITYSEYCYNFNSLYKHIQEYGLDDINVCGKCLGDDFYTVQDVRYFRGDTDKVELEIPIGIVENPEQFMNEAEELIQTVEAKEEKRKQEAEIAEKQRRREMYEQLKAEFGD